MPKVFCCLVGILVLISAACPLHASGWTPVNSEQPTYADLNDVHGTSATDVYAVGEEGTVLHWNGTAWTNMLSGTSLDLNGVWAISSDLVYAVGDDGCIASYDGNVWRIVAETGTEEDLNAVWGSSATNVYAVGDDGAKVHWNGTAWSPVTFPEEITYDLNDIWGIGNECVYVVGDETDIWHSRGTGHTFPGGTHWEKQEQDITVDELSSVWGISEDFIYIAKGISYNSLKPTVVIRKNGATWGAVPGAEFAKSAGDIWVSPAGSTHVVTGNSIGGSQSEIWQYNNAVWKQDSGYLLDKASLNAVWGVGEDCVFAVGNDGGLYRFDGERWTSISGQYQQSVRSLYSVEGGSTYAAADNGTVYRFNSTDLSMCNETGTAVDLHGIWGDSDENLYAAGDDGNIVHYNGTEWSLAHVTTDGEDLRGIWGAHGNAVYVAGSSNGIHVWNGTDWKKEELDKNYSVKSIWGDSESNIYAGGYSGLLHYDGQNWSEVQGTFDLRKIQEVVGTKTGKLYLAADEYLYFNDGKEWKRTRGPDGDVMYGCWVDAEDTVYLTSKQSVYVSDGAFWKRLGGFSSTLLDIHGKNSDEIYVCGYTGILAQFNGVGLVDKDRAVQQPEGVTVTVKQTVQNSKSKEEMQQEYQLDAQITPRTGAIEFAANTTQVDGNAVFTLELTGENSKVEDVRLVKLFPGNGTSTLFGPYNAHPILNTLADGEWWIQQESEVLPIEYELDPDTRYTVYFTVQDNGKYDLDRDTAGNIRDPFTLGTVSPESDGDDSSSGCSTSATQSISMELAALLLIACVALIRSGMRRRSSK